MRRRVDCHGNLADRMFECEPHGLQCDPAGESLLRAVFSIPHDRVTCRSQLDADLMASPRLRSHLQQRRITQRFESPKGQQAFPRLGGRRGHRSYDILLTVLHKSVEERPHSGGDAPFDEGLVDLFDAAAPKLLRQSTGGFARPREQDDSRYGAIQSMHNSHKDVAGLAVTLAKVVPREIDERHIARSITDRQESRRLVNRQAVIVLVEHAQPGIPRRRVAFRRGHRITKSLIEGALSAFN